MAITSNHNSKALFTGLIVSLVLVIAAAVFFHIGWLWYAIVPICLSLVYFGIKASRRTVPSRFDSITSLSGAKGGETSKSQSENDVYVATLREQEYRLRRFFDTTQMS